MNFIYSILMFFVLGTTSFLLRNVFGSDHVHNVLIIIGTLFFIVTGFFFFVCFFQTMNLREAQRRDFNDYYYKLKDLQIKISFFEEIKKEFQDYFTKNYPEYEKEIFSKMSPKEAEHLSVYMAKYPELKYNGVLESFMEKIFVCMKQIKEEENSIDYEIRNIKNRQENDWYLFKVAIPQEIKDKF